jgi:uncharacterized membrane protein YjfL (UPF0719 family)
MLNLTFAPALIEAQSAAPDMKGALLGLFLGAFQLIVSLALFTFAINSGLKVVSKMIEGIDIWDEIKKKNVAVALLAAGAVIAYVNVVAGGISGMTNGLTGLVSGNFSNGLSAVLGGVVNLLVALFVAGIAISWTFKVMDRLTTTINEKEEFKNNNIAIGVVYAGILIGASSLISAGVSGVSAAVTNFLNAVIH